MGSQKVYRTVQNNDKLNRIRKSTEERQIIKMMLLTLLVLSAAVSAMKHAHRETEIQKRVMSEFSEVQYVMVTFPDGEMRKAEYRGVDWMGRVQVMFADREHEVYPRSRILKIAEHFPEESQNYGGVLADMEQLRF